MNLRVSDGTTTVTLNDNTTGLVLSYTPRTIEAPEGGVYETVQVVLYGAIATIRTTLQTLNNLFRQAATYRERKVGSRVFVEMQIADGEDWYRSELLEGSPVPIGETMDAGLFGNKVQIQLAWRRVNWWEGEETVLALTNGNGTNVNTGLVVHPITDATHSNYVAIAGDDITGDLPAPIKVELENTYNSADRLGDVWMSLNTYSYPALLDHILEGEDADSGATPTGPFASYYSGSYYGSVTLPTSEGTVCYWDLDSTFLQNCRGNDFHILAKLSQSPVGDVWGRLRVTYLGLTELSSGPLVKLANSTYQDLGVMRLPPYRIDGETLESIRLELRLKRPAGSTSMGLDFLQLMPIDGFRKISHKGYDMIYGATLIDNQIDDQVYLNGGSGIAARNFQVPYGSKLLLEPGVVQKVYFFYEGSHAGLRTAKAKISYRPRRLVL